MTDMAAKKPTIKTEPVKNPAIAKVPDKKPLAKPEPAKVGPIKKMPAANAPAKAEPAKNLDAAITPNKKPPNKVGPAKAGPAKNAPVANAALKNPPAKAEPAKKPAVANVDAKKPLANAVPAPKKPVQLPPVQPPPESRWRMQWTGFDRTAVPLLALAALFGIRIRRMTGKKLDGLTMLLLSQIGILLISALQGLLPNLGVWRGGSVFLLVALVPLLGLHMSSLKDNKLDEIDLALLVQVGLLALFLAVLWLPFQWIRFVAGATLLSALIPFLRSYLAYRKGASLSGIQLLLLVQIGIFAYFVANRWMPSLWVQIGESTLLVVTLAIVLVLHDKRRKVVKSEQVMFRLVAVGIVLVVIFGFLFPITSWG
jgi:hypothetical protein